MMLIGGGERHGGKRGRGAPHKVPFVAAVATNEEHHPIAMRFSKLKSFSKAEIARWAQKHLEPSCTVVSDGLDCFAAVTKIGCNHVSIVTAGGPNSVKHEEFTWVNTMIGNVKKYSTGYTIRLVMTIFPVTLRSFVIVLTIVSILPAYLADWPMLLLEPLRCL
ncbi:MAG: transposase [Candidatus Thiodiazotropha sp. (ex Lucinoma aequizonata)]|nr:transposase [Candidatus Thiodiazotropha sp. (ex Lucinoma aequizonata)]